MANDWLLLTNHLTKSGRQIMYIFFTYSKNKSFLCFVCRTRCVYFGNIYMRLILKSVNTAKTIEMNWLNSVNTRYCTIERTQEYIHHQYDGILVCICLHNKISTYVFQNIGPIKQFPQRVFTIEKYKAQNTHMCCTYTTNVCVLQNPIAVAN